MSRTHSVLLGLVLVVAAWLAFWGIGVGLPSGERLQIELGGRDFLESRKGEIHDFLAGGAYRVRQENEMQPDAARAAFSPFADMTRSYHSDEQFTLKTLSRMVANRDPQPHCYTYGQFYHYLVGGALGAAVATGWLPRSLSQEYLIFHPDIAARLYLAGRLLMGLLGVGTVAVLFAAVRRLTGKTEIALLAAELLAVTPLFSLWAKIIKPDLPLSFFLTCALYFSVGLYRESRWSDWIGLGIAMGLATGCKYVAPLYGVVPACWLLMRCGGNRQALAEAGRRLCGAAGIAIGVFAVFNFSWLTDWTVFWGDLLGASGLVASQRNIFARVAEYGANFLFDGFFWHIGVVGTPVLLWVMTAGLRRVDRRFLPMALGAWCFFLLAGSAVVPQSDQYLLPGAPLGCAVIAAWIESFRRKWVRDAWCVALLLSGVWYAVALDVAAAGTNPRLTASIWASQQIPEQAAIGRSLYPVSYRTVMLPPGRWRSWWRDGGEITRVPDFWVESTYQFSGVSDGAFGARLRWLRGEKTHWPVRFADDFAPGDLSVLQGEKPWTLARWVHGGRGFTLNSALETVTPEFFIWKRGQWL